MLPENLNDYAKTQAFLDISAAHKSDAIKSQLDELGVEYLANDNKTALIYRLLEAQGNLPTPVDDDEVDDDEVADEVQDETDEVQDETDDAKSDAVVVISRHFRHLYEPATGTLIAKQATTYIYPTDHVSRERILDNLRQIMYLHRDVLSIEGE